MLLANHGPVVAGKNLDDAVYATEELEETAKLFLALRGMETNPLTHEQADDLHKRFPPDLQANSRPPERECTWMEFNSPGSVRGDFAGSRDRMC
jgi:hypothetical protein